MDSFITIEPEQGSSLFFVNNSLVEGGIINTHFDRPFPGLPKKVAQLLAEDLNNLEKEDLEDETYNISLVYCVLSTFIESGGDHQFDIDLPFTIQWDRAYRLNPGPPLQLQELSAIASIISFLGDSWIDLPLNYSQSLEEMKENEVPAVPETIIKILDAKLKTFNEVETFAVDLLFNLFERVSITACILWVSGILDNKDLLLISYILYGSIDNIDNINVESDVHFQIMGKRLDMLCSIINLSRQQSILKATEKDENKYESRKFGQQEWMITNLSVETFRNGDAIKQVDSEEEWNDVRRNEEPAWCHYDFDEKNGVKYGKLYNWFAINDPRGLSPQGWQVPGGDDWTRLEKLLGGKEIAGASLKMPGFWGKASEDESPSGFNALPGGLYGTSIFNQIEESAYFWTSDSFMAGDTPNAVYRCLVKGEDHVVKGGYFTYCFMSVRCVRY